MANVYNLNDNGLQVVEGTNISYNKDVILTLTTDDGDQSILVCKLYCTIITNTSIQYYMSVIDKSLYQSYKDTIQTVIDEFKATATQLAKDNGVPII